MSLLFGFLRSLVSAQPPSHALAEDTSPLARQRRLKHAHKDAPMAAHLDIVYGALSLGGRPHLPVLRETLAASQTLVPPLKALRRPLAAYFLARYFLYSLGIQGERAECGVFQGASALHLCTVAREAQGSFDGTGLHLVDSFEGISGPSEHDRITVPGSGGTREAFVAPGAFAGPLEDVRTALAGFPGIQYHKGWIPKVLDELPQARWSFVHVDVDLYEPTHACLEYFYPRLAPGGVMVCDDYGSAWFPGAFRAWDRYCDEQGLPFVVLDTGQSVLLKPA